VDSRSNFKRSIRYQPSLSAFPERPALHDLSQASRSCAGLCGMGFPLQ